MGVTHTTPASVTDAVTRILELVGSRPARLGGDRLLCIDGPAGAGKSTLADGIVAASPGSGLVRLDELLDGWEGLHEVAETLSRDVLLPLAEGRAGSYRRYDWVAGEFAERVRVTRHRLLVVEGVGSGSLVTAALRSALVWVEAPTSVRRLRGVARDGDAFAGHWDSWATQEERLFATQRTRSTADLVIQTFA